MSEESSDLRAQVSVLTNEFGLIKEGQKRLEINVERLLTGQSERRDNEEKRVEATITRAIQGLKDTVFERLSANDRGLAEIRPQVEDIKRSQLTAGKPNYPVIIAGASFLLGMTLAIVTAGGYFTNSKVDSRVLPLESAAASLRIGQDAIAGRVSTLASREDLSPLRAEVDRLRSRDQVIASENATSKAERTELMGRLGALDANLSAIQVDRKEFQAFTKAHLTEVETQFRAAAQFENLRAANARRETAMLWEKAFGTRYPDRDFFPDISQTKPGGN